MVSSYAYFNYSEQTGFWLVGIVPKDNLNWDEISKLDKLTKAKK